MKANPGMKREGIAVTCSSTRLSEVRICLTRDLQFRDCHDVDRRACRRDKLGDAAGARGMKFTARVV